MDQFYLRWGHSMVAGCGSRLWLRRAAHGEWRVAYGELTSASPAMGLSMRRQSCSDAGSFALDFPVDVLVCYAANMLSLAAGVGPVGPVGSPAGDGNHEMMNKQIWFRLRRASKQCSA